MPARPPQWGSEQPLGPDEWGPPTPAAEITFELELRGDGRDATDGERAAELDLRGDGQDAADGEPAAVVPYPANRIANLLRRTVFGAAVLRIVLRIAAHPKDGSQLVAAYERISLTLIWSVTAILALGIVRSRSTDAVLAVLGLVLTGFVLLGTRWRRGKDESGPPPPPPGGT